jgi:hypothetical protein
MTPELTQLINDRRKAYLERQGDERVKAISEYLGLFSSANRGAALADILAQEPERLRFKIFHCCWEVCDDTWFVRDRIRASLRVSSRYRAARYFSQDQKDFFDALPSVVTVYRGCPPSPDAWGRLKS